MEEVLGSETIKTLKQQGGVWPAPPNDYVPELEVVEGIPFHKFQKAGEKIEMLRTLEARPDDVFVVSYPKTGTTWTQEIVSSICHNGDIDKVNKSPTIFRVPYMERTAIVSTKDVKVPSMVEILNKMKSPRTIKTHLPGHLMPPDIWKKKSRIVYIARNPKDVAVSYYYFHQFAMALPNYDDMKSIVERIATFLGYSFSDEIVEGIVSHCTFDNMKRNLQTNFQTVMYSGNNNVTFMRKGKVGDWKNHFTVAQNQAMDAFIEEKLKGTGLKFD